MPQPGFPQAPIGRLKSLCAYALQFFDDDHSDVEDRFIMLGMSSEARLLVVVHCERESGDVIRIISARRATRSEATFYRGD